MLWYFWKCYDLDSKLCKRPETGCLVKWKSSQWASISAWGTPRISAHPLFVLVYINDLVDNVESNVKMFANDTSLFSGVCDEATSAQQLNRDLERVRIASKFEEVILSSKRIKPYHPNQFHGNTKIERKSEHKHLGLILISKLNFQSHWGNGIVRYLSQYV